MKSCNYLEQSSFQNLGANESDDSPARRRAGAAWVGGREKRAAGPNLRSAQGAGRSPHFVQRNQAVRARPPPPGTASFPSGSPWARAPVSPECSPGLAGRPWALPAPPRALALPDSQPRTVGQRSSHLTAVVALSRSQRRWRASGSPRHPGWH